MFWVGAFGFDLVEKKIPNPGPLFLPYKGFRGVRLRVEKLRRVQGLVRVVGAREVRVCAISRFKSRVFNV